jgi:hypothetical protein
VRFPAEAQGMLADHRGDAIMANEPRRCAHQGCACRVDENTRYCSAGCETAAAGGTRDHCPCGHPGCANSVSNASSEGRPASNITGS